MTHDSLIHKSISAALRYVGNRILSHLADPDPHVLDLDADDSPRLSYVTTPAFPTDSCEESVSEDGTESEKSCLEDGDYELVIHTSSKDLDPPSEEPWDLIPQSEEIEMSR